MGASYDKLWHLLIDRHMSKTQLIKEAHISTNAMAHLGKNEDVRVEVLSKDMQRFKLRSRRHNSVFLTRLLPVPVLRRSSDTGGTGC